MRVIRKVYSILLIAYILVNCTSPDHKINVQDLPYNIYPEVNNNKPGLHSPFISEQNEEYVIAKTNDNTYAIIPVTLSNDKGICKQLVVDTLDFPSLVKSGLHSENELDQIESITGWSLDTISYLGRPGELSSGGFIAVDEDVLSVIRSDNRIVKKLDMTHPELAKPLFHVLNMMDMDLSLDRWNMARHQWDNINSFYYNGNVVYTKVYDTKGGQRSIFNDSIQGAFHIQLWHEFNDNEISFIKDKYGHLSEEEMEDLKASIGFLNIGEMQPQYIMRYGFYEGHTFWRACPIAISFIFGFKTIHELNDLFEGKLDEVVATHF